MSKKLLIMAFIGILFMTGGTKSVMAGDVDILINKLVQKKILTQDEASTILQEMQKENEVQKEEIKQTVKDTVDKSIKDKAGIPDWLERTKVKGDVRVRYQGQDRDNDGKVSRDRGRIRARVGVESKVNDKWKLGIGMASGGADPRSTNQTFDDTFSTKGWNLDYAFAQFSPTKNLSMIAGKFNNPIWGTKDLLWDSDINPEGIAAKINFKPSENFEVFVTPAYFILEEFSGTRNDPAIIAFQPGINWKINDRANLKFALSYYAFDNVQGNDLSVHSSGTNSVDASGKWVYDHDSISFDAEVGFNIAEKIPYGAIFGQYVSSDAGSDDQGWLMGLKVGHKKVEKLGQWQFVYNYRELEKDAWVDFMPDSDFYDGDTGVKGSEFELNLGLNKNVSFGLDYYKTKAIDRNFGQDEYIFQADLIVKF